MIYDCFIFYNELDLLEIRLNILKDVVDKFVVVEGVRTHTGKPKPLYFEENKARFAAYTDRIIHIVVDDTPEIPANYSVRQASWLREDWQRNAIMRGLKDAQPDDVVMICDVDEIPRPELVAQFRHRRLEGIVSMNMEVFAYYLNYKNYTHVLITAPKVLRFGTFKKLEESGNLRPLAEHDPLVNTGVSPTNVRCHSARQNLKNAGWHFSYLGGADAVVKKIGSIAIEFANEKNTNVDWVAQVIERGDDINGCGGKYFAVPVVGPRYPKWLVDNQSRYAQLIYTATPDYYRRTKWQRRKQFLRGFIRKNGAKLIPACLKGFLYDKVYCRLVKDPISIVG